MVHQDDYRSANEEAVAFGGQPALSVPWSGEPLQKLSLPKTRNILVTNTEPVRQGTVLIDGDINPHDILKVKGQAELAEYLLKQIQDVYRL